MDGVLSTPHALWINPSGIEFAGTSVDRFVQTLGDRVRVELLGLRVWRASPGEAYGMPTSKEAMASGLLYQ